VVELDPTTFDIVRSARAGVEPYGIVASDDCSTLYTAPLHSSSIARVRASDLTVLDRLPLGGDELSAARSMSVAPGQAQTVAVTLRDIESSLCSGTDHGIVIFDGTTPRPTWQAPMMFGIKSVVFGANPGILYGEDYQNVYAFTADANGLSNQRTVLPDVQSTFLYDIGRDLYFDARANRVYTLFGSVFDAGSNTALPRINLWQGPLIGGCGAPGQARVTDATTGKLFWAGSASIDRIGVSAYPSNGLARGAVVEFQLSDLLGYVGLPADMIRLSNNRIAYVTDAGYLFVMQGPMLAP
jgi:hypothetical protein